MRHFNSATKPPCAPLPGVYSSDTTEMKERGWCGGAGAVGADGRRGEEEGEDMKVNHGGWERKERGE